MVSQKKCHLGSGHVLCFNMVSFWLVWPNDISMFYSFLLLKKNGCQPYYIGMNISLSSLSTGNIVVELLPSMFKTLVQSPPCTKRKGTKSKHICLAHCTQPTTTIAATTAHSQNALHQLKSVCSWWYYLPTIFLDICCLISTRELMSQSL